MVENLDLHINKIRTTFSEYQKFLDESSHVISNKTDLISYITSVNESQVNFENYLNDLNQENSIHLYGLIGSISRLFSEFNWFDDYDFYTTAQKYLDTLTEEKIIIYNYFLDGKNVD